MCYFIHCHWFWIEYWRCVLGGKTLWLRSNRAEKTKALKKTQKTFFFCLGKIRSISHLECIRWLVYYGSREWSVSNVSYSSRRDCNTNAHQFQLLDAPLVPCDCYCTKSNDPVGKIAIYQGICGLGLSRSKNILFSVFQKIRWFSFFPKYSLSRKIGTVFFCVLHHKSDLRIILRMNGECKGALQRNKTHKPSDLCIWYVPNAGWYVFISFFNLLDRFSLKNSTNQYYDNSLKRRNILELFLAVETGQHNFVISI